MKKGLLFIGIVITSMLMLFTNDLAKSFPGHSPVIKNEIGYSISGDRIAEQGLPFNRSHDENAPIFKATPSCSAQPSTYFIRLPQHGLNPFQSLFEINTIEKWNVAEPSVIRSLRMILCQDIISPNAP